VTSPEHGAAGGFELPCGALERRRLKHPAWPAVRAAGFASLEPVARYRDHARRAGDTTSSALLSRRLAPPRVLPSLRARPNLTSRSRQPGDCVCVEFAVAQAQPEFGRQARPRRDVEQAQVAQQPQGVVWRTAVIVMHDRFIGDGRTVAAGAAISAATAR
jgi:hypothetical protein